MAKCYRFIWLPLIVSLCLSIPAVAKNNSESTQAKQTSAASTAEGLRVHNVGNFWLSVTNYGILGSESGNLRDPCTGEPAPSAEFPAGSGINYLWIGGIWVGAIKGEGEAETLVSVGLDGWQNVNEMRAVVPFESRTTRLAGIQQGSCFIPYSPEAISEQDFLAIYSDTCLNPANCESDPLDGPFSALGIRVTQNSYAWGQDFAKDFVLLDFVLENVGSVKLSKIYVGFYIDADVHNPQTDPSGFTDDISGFMRVIPSYVFPGYLDTINLAWTADNNGLSINPPVFGPTGIAGIRLLRPERPGQFSFNWWNSSSDPIYDWGPWRISSLSRRPGMFPGGVLGTPEGNKAKYFMMSNGEIDYDQLMSALSIWQDSGWLPPPGYISDLADGYDTRYLLSFGPFDLNPGDTSSFTLAYVAGEDFHVRVDDWYEFQGLVWNLEAVMRYYSKLDFSDIGLNALWAGWMYDNPGLDTDGDGYKGKYRIIEGDTIYYQGDGVPDFKGPQPPLAPQVSCEYALGSMILHWNGKRTETSRDLFSREKDFEGYRIYLSRSGKSEDLIMIDTYDKIDYSLSVFNPGTQQWALKIASISADSIIKLFEKDNICCFDDGFGNCVCLDSACTDPNSFGTDPEYWTKANPYIYKGTCTPELKISPLVTIRTGDKIAIAPQDYNWGLLDIKKHKDLILAGKLTPADPEYYEYEYVIRNVGFRSQVLASVTAFDYGSAQVRVEPQENDPRKNVFQTCRFFRGDMDYSGELNLRDIVDLTNYLFGRGRFACRLNLNSDCGSPELFRSADTDGSGRVTVEDVLTLVKYFFAED